MTFSKLKVRLHMKSGRTVSFLCNSISRTEEGNDLTSLETEGGALPLYIRLTEIEAITTRWVRGVFL